MDYDWLCGTFTIAYFLGSIPFGLILTKLAGMEDIRNVGSGNIGATNVMRTGHPALAFFTLLLDTGKGVLAVWAVRYIYSSDYALLACLFAVIGHIFPVWLHFKGGKGVATAMGVLLGVNWMLGLIVGGLWLIVFAWTRTSSLAALMSIGYSAIIAYLVVGDVAALICLTLAALIIYTHRLNIERLITGTEHNFREKMS